MLFSKGFGDEGVVAVDEAMKKKNHNSYKTSNEYKENEERESVLEEWSSYTMLPIKFA